MQKNGETEREFEIWNPVKNKIKGIAPPNFWILISFDKNVQMPNQCSNPDWENCVCICPNLLSLTKTFGGNYPKKCDEKGICVDSKINVITYSRKEIALLNPPTKVHIEKVADSFVIKKI